MEQTLLSMFSRCSPGGSKTIHSLSSPVYQHQKCLFVDRQFNVVVVRQLINQQRNQYARILYSDSNSAQLLVI